MKISNSKKQLAEIIHENDGWIAGNFASQQDDGEVWFSVFKPTWKTRCGTFDADYEGHFTIGHLIANRHQTILSRDEYFHLYPAVETAPVPVPEAKPTIEQLAADYRNRKDYADRKQQEADAAKADAEVKLAELVAAGKALGLVLSVGVEEPALVITDWRGLQVGDVIEVTGSHNEAWYKVKGEELTVKVVRADGASTGRWLVRGNTEFRLIRRPAKGADNA